MTTFNLKFATRNTKALNTVSNDITIVKMGWDKKTESIVIVGSDNKVRTCRTKLADKTQLPAFAKALRYAIANGSTVSLIAAGGFSTEKWFSGFRFTGGFDQEMSARAALGLSTD